MIVEKEKSQIITNMNSGQKFGMEPSAEAFAMLSGLYVNKIKAIVQELGCNAADSHEESGQKEKPFEVTLPTRLEPWFSVKDTGLGLDADGVRDVYTVYFKSTKRTTNRADGTLGIGSKSPFSYTDQFIVVARKNGVEYTYQMLLDEERCPDYVLMSEIETEEPNGVEVRVPVYQEDIWNFRNEAYRVYQCFSVPPVITNSDPVAKLELNPEHPVEFTGLTGWYSGYYALMGNVLYRIPIDEIKLDEGEELSIPAIRHKKSIEGSAVFVFNRGELNFLPSREELSLDRKTNAALKSRLREAEQWLYSGVKEKYKNAKSFEEIRGFEEDCLFQFYKKELTVMGWPIDSYCVDFGGLLNEAKHINDASREYVNRFKQGVQVDENGYVYDTVRLQSISYCAVLRPYDKRSIAVFVNEGLKYLKFLRKHIKSSTPRIGKFIETTPEFLDDVLLVLSDFDVIVYKQSEMIESGIRPPRPESHNSTQQKSQYVSLYDKASNKKFADKLYTRAETTEMLNIALERGDRVVVMPRSAGEASFIKTINTRRFTVFSVPATWATSYFKKEGVISLTEVPDILKQELDIKKLAHLSLSSDILSGVSVHQLTKLIDLVGAEYLLPGERKEVKNFTRTKNAIIENEWLIRAVGHFIDFDEYYTDKQKESKNSGEYYMKIENLIDTVKTRVYNEFPLLKNSIHYNGMEEEIQLYVKLKKEYINE